MNREAFKPGIIWEKIKGEKPKTRSGRIVKRALAAGAVLALVTYADFVQTGARGVFDKYSEDTSHGTTPFADTFKSCSAQERLSSTGAFKSEIEHKFGVEIANRDKIKSITTYLENGDHVDIDTVEWDNRSLFGLYKALCAVPTHMYSIRTEEEKTYEVNFATNPVIQDYFKTGLPDNIYQFEFDFPNNTKVTLSREMMQQGLDFLRKGTVQIYSGANLSDVNLQFLLVDKDYNVRSVLSRGEYRHFKTFDSKNDTVVLVRAPENEKSYLQVIVHEMTHRIHALRGNKMDAELFKILGVKDQIEFKEAKFAKSRNSVFTVLRRMLDRVKRDKSLTMGILDAGSSFPEHLEYGKTNSNEFTSVGAEYYIYGKKTFLITYTPFMGEEKSVKFYDFLKKNVFQGKEY